MSGSVSLQARLQASKGSFRLDLELDTAPGTLVIAGPNGAGKTTLLLLLLGLRPVQAGFVRLGGDILLDTEKHFHIPPERRRMAYMPQSYALFPHLSVEENIAFALGCAPHKLDRAARRERIHSLLKELDLEGYGPRRIHTLSGGEKQRVALARALSVEPRALLLDEPLSALDIHTRGEVRNFLAAYLKRLNLPTVVVTHSAADAQMLGHRIAILEAGRITQMGTWDELVQRPASRFVEEFTA